MGRPALLLRSQTWEVLEMKLTTGGAIRIRRTYLCTYMRVCQYCKLCRNATETYSPQILGRSWETGKRQLEVLGSPTFRFPDKSGVEVALTGQSFTNEPIKTFS